MDPIPAGLIPQHFLDELVSLLSPDNPLNRDVRDLAGKLDFGNDEIRYICNRPRPFAYMLDQWCKREGDRATLENLMVVLEELMRPDCKRIVEAAIKEIQSASFEKLQKLVKVKNNRMDEVNTTGFVNLQRTDTLVGRNGDTNVVNTTNKSTLVTAFILYFPESDNHMSNLQEFIKYLRSCAIDVKFDRHESLLEAQSKQLYVLSNIQKCDYVFLICSSTLCLAEEVVNNKKAPKISEKLKELAFAVNQIVSDLYRHKQSAKYIPILLPECNASQVPRFLKTAKRYSIPKDNEDLIRRIYGVEKYELYSEKRKFRPSEVYQ